MVRPGVVWLVGAATCGLRVGAINVNGVCFGCGEECSSNEEEGELSEVQG